MTMPGFTAEASLDKPHGHYHGAHAFTQAGRNALLPAQVWSEWCPDPWSARCFRSCEWQCSRRCGSDRWCFVNCRDDCYWQCNCIVP
jgi:hypothetical protein